MHHKMLEVVVQLLWPLKDNINLTANIYAGMAERSQAFTYAMLDMDKNGIDELIVSSKNGSEVLDIFTLKD